MRNRNVAVAFVAAAGLIFAGAGPAHAKDTSISLGSCAANYGNSQSTDRAYTLRTFGSCTAMVKHQHVYHGEGPHWTKYYSNTYTPSIAELVYSKHLVSTLELDLWP